MIITCNNCNKNFDLDSNLIPEKGRLLQCNSCNYKWFFEKKFINDDIETLKNTKPNDEVEPFNKKVSTYVSDSLETIELSDSITKNSSVQEKILFNDKEDKNLINETFVEKKNYNILGLIIVFIISFIALIIVIDTFQKPISSIIPNIEFLLYSLYETFNDIGLFFKDLIS
jgi:predicted Zn finger-like uncharacterized protein|tara:strand:+ start:95 stop:607 length:513 start_codon:yes stop_codon:yes gene_type:complete